MNWSRIIRNLFTIVTIVFALIGFAFTSVYVAMHFGLLNVRGSISERNAFFHKPEKASLESSSSTEPVPCDTTEDAICAWNMTREWIAIAGGLTKDAEIISRVSRETGVSKRVIASVVIPEQIRFFTSEREIFKSYFEPLKILGSLSQFSLGVSGIKEATAEAIELHANDETSPFYPGAGLAELIVYKDDDEHDGALYQRLTDPKDHYYSYLYTALYIKEIEAQWRTSGIDITDEAGVIGTLWNIGFEHSKPNTNPQIGGAVISSGGKDYTFGELSQLFYHSNELRSVFPK